MNAPIHEFPAGQRRARRDKHPGRIAIEQLLQNSPEPLTKAEIASKCDQPLLRVHLVLGALEKVGNAHRITAFSLVPRFAWGPAAVTAATVERPRPVQQPRPRPIAAPQPRRTDCYDGRELQPFTGRPGAMDAFALPSIHNGQIVPRCAPIIMGCTPLLIRKKTL